MNGPFHIVIIGGGIAGLGLALNLHERGIPCEVFEAVSEVREIGVGITLLPHASRELKSLGVLDQLEAVGIENYESVFFNRHGQLIYQELRGRHAGYDTPELGVHRGKLHKILFDRAMKVLGPDRIHTGHRCTRVEQDDSSVRIHFVDAQGQSRVVESNVAVACDGVNSAVRKQLFPQDALCFAGINTWRGVTIRKPILTGKSYIRIGTIETGKMVIYPIVDNVDGQGNQLINWMAEIRQPGQRMNDWNQPGQLEDVLPLFDRWTFDWLDVPDLIRQAQRIFEYPMVDKNPLPWWTSGRITLMGDAAHPMYPRGSNGSAQGLIDARTLADLLAAPGVDALQALRSYEQQRLPATTQVVQTNRNVPPDAIIMKVDELTQGKPFERLDDFITQDELRQISDNYKQIAGFALKANS